MVINLTFVKKLDQLHLSGHTELLYVAVAITNVS